MLTYTKNPDRQAEFEETILEDLALMGLHGDVISHTSDYFDQLYEYAIQMLRRAMLMLMTRTRRQYVLYIVGYSLL